MMNAKKLMNFKSKQVGTEAGKKPRISKTAVAEPLPNAVVDLPVTTADIEPEVAEMPEPKPAKASQKVQPQAGVSLKTADQKQQLLAVESYEDAEALLSADPDLIEPARQVFGSIVPTVNQNRFMELAIQATASDASLTLGAALQTKRRERLNLSTPETRQLLEFASENVTKSTELALFMAILITDDLTSLKETDLWQTQKAVVTKTAKRLGVDPLKIWEEMNGKAPVVDVKEPPQMAEAIKAETIATPADKALPVPPRPKPKQGKKRSKRVRYEIRRVDGPPRWLMAMGLLGLTTVASCGVCALAIF